MLIYYELRATMADKGGVHNDKIQSKVMLAIREMTQKDLAEKTGIRPPTISAICTNTIKHLPVDALNKICAALDCQPADLMEYVADKD